MKTEIRPAVADDIPAIAANARAADVQEMAVLGLTVERALQGGMQVSDWSYTGLVDDVPVCMFGVAPRSVLTGEGIPWMLGTNGLEPAQVPFLRLCRPVVTAMQAAYPRLANVIDARNTVAMRWLRWLGFRFDDAPVHLNGQTFLIFRKGTWS